MRFAAQPARDKVLIALGSLVAIAAAIILAYYPGLHGPFVFDDNVNIVNNNSIAIQSLGLTDLVSAASSNESGILKRPLPALSFSLNYYFSAGFTNTFSFKITNLIIHFVNAVLVFWFSSLLLRIHAENTGFRRGKWHIWLPCLVAAVWALHPLQLTSVLYVVQRITSLSTLFVLAGLIAFVHGRRLLRDRNPRGVRLMWIGLLAGTILGLACKENAALLPLYALIIEFAFFREPARGRNRKILMQVYSIPLVLLGLLALFLLFRYSDLILGAYNLREFTLGERLLTEPRILWLYLGLLLLPTSNRFSLFHDDITVSTGLFDPWTTSLALAGLILVVIAALLSRRKYPVLSFAILWFLAGHSMESSFIGLELVYEHRNYLPSLGPIAGTAYGIAVASGRFKNKSVQLALVLLVISAITFTTHVLAKIWASEQELAAFMLKHHPKSAKSHAMAAELYLHPRNDPVQALNHYKIAADLAPHETRHLIRMVVVSAFTAVQQVNITPSTHVSTHASQNRQILPGLAKITTNDERMHLTLDQAIYDRITQQLQSQPVHARVEKMLRDLTDCILQQPDYCGYLYDHAVNWNELALNSPRSHDSIRKSLIINLAKLYLEHGDLDRAMQMANRSGEIDPYHPTLAIMRANIFYIANRLDDAEKTILSVKQGGLIIDNENQKQAEKLLSMIRQQRGKTGAE